MFTILFLTTITLTISLLSVCALTFSCWNANSLTAVSYTHLDVYKRQVLPFYHADEFQNG